MPVIPSPTPHPFVTTKCLQPLTNISGGQHCPQWKTTAIGDGCKSDFDVTLYSGCYRLLRDKCHSFRAEFFQCSLGSQFLSLGSSKGMGLKTPFTPIQWQLQKTHNLKLIPMSASCDPGSTILEYSYHQGWGSCPF